MNTMKYNSMNLRWMNFKHMKNYWWSFIDDEIQDEIRFIHEMSYVMHEI